jgi:hypothetical protein
LLHQTNKTKYYENIFKKSKPTDFIRTSISLVFFNPNNFKILMKDLIDFNRFQIEALQAEICKLKQENNLLSTYCFEALEEGITQEYKTLIKQQIYQLKQN